VLDGPVDIITLVVFLHPQDVSGLEPAVSRMFLGQSLEKSLCHLSQCQKGLPDRLKAVAYLFSPEVIRVFHLLAQPCGIALMPGDEFDLRSVDQDLMFRGLEAQDVGDVAGGDGVVIRLKLDITVWAADPKRHFGAVIGMKGQRLQRFLRKELQGSVPGRVVDMEIGFLFEPPPGSGPKVLHILEVSSV